MTHLGSFRSIFPNHEMGDGLRDVPAEGDPCRGGDMPRSRMLVLACAVVATGGWRASGASPLEIETRIAAQRAIEGVYWQHRIWPSDNPDPKPSLGGVLSESVLRA